MGKYTGIQWCDTTVNPTTGCDGCELWSLVGRMPARFGGPCYAGNQHEGRLSKAMPALYAPTFREVRLAPGRMAKAASLSDLTGTARPDKPWLDGLPRMIFVGDMGDVMSRKVPFEYVAEEMIGNMTSARGSRHVWMILTKNPGRLLDFFRWYHARRGGTIPPNLWVGTSVTSVKTLSRLDALSQIRSVVRFASVEPLLEMVDLYPWLSAAARIAKPLEWVILGGESDQKGRKGRYFDTLWARCLRDQCFVTGVPFFLKQLGSAWANREPNEGGKPRDSHGGNLFEWPVDLRVREFPATRATEGLVG